MKIMPAGLTEKNADKKMAVTKVYLKPKVEFSGENQPDEDELMKMHDKAHAECFISNSVLTEVIVEPQINGHRATRILPPRGWKQKSEYGIH